MQAASNAVQDHVLNPVEGNILGDHQPAADPSGRTMKALTWQGARKVEISEVPVPGIAREEDAILRITGTTICGSDLHLFNGEIPTLKQGDILGHEFMGVIDKIGSNVHKLKEGDRVVVSFQAACGQCRFCKQKLSSMCDRTNDSPLVQKMWGGGKGCFASTAAFFGYSGMTGRLPGGQAEYIRVPFADVNCLKVPADMHDEQVIYLSDVLPTSYHCVVDTGVQDGDVIGVWGLGPIGQCAVRWAFIKGAKRVIAIDSVPARLEMARKAGAEVINFKECKDIVGKLQEMVPLGLDCALDCGTFHEPKGLLHKVEKTLMLETDSSETLNEMVMTVRKMGRIGLIAVYSGFTNHFNVGAIMERGIRFIGNGQAPVHLYWEEILKDYIQTGKFDPTFMITHRVPLEDFPELYEAFDKRVDGVEKVFVETQFSSKPMPGTPQVSRVRDWSKQVV